MNEPPSKKASPRKRAGDGPDAPEVSFEELPAGRETLAAISFDRPTRLRANTHHYGDRISNAPGAISPKTARALDTHPDVSVSLEPLGRRTQLDIEEALDDGPSIEVDGLPTRLPELDALSIERLVTFVVDDPDRALDNPRNSEVLLRSRLLPALGATEHADLSRFELSRTEGTTVVVRLWFRVS